MDSDIAEAMELLLSQVEKRCRSHLPVPQHLRGDGTNLASTSPVAASPTTSSALNNRVATEKFLRRSVHQTCLLQVAQLTPWCAQIDEACTKAEAAVKELETLGGLIGSLDHVTVAVREQSDNLSAGASALMVKRAQLERTHDIIQETLSKFTAVDDIAREVAHPMLSASTVRFSALLDEIEEADAFLQSVPEYKSTKAYSRKLQVAHQRAMLCLKDACEGALHTATNEVMTTSSYIQSFHNSANVPYHVASAIKAGHGEIGDEAQTLGVVAAKVNSSFIQNCEGSQSLRRMLEARCGPPEKDVYISDTLSTYCDCRLKLMGPLLADYISEGLKTTKDLRSFIIFALTQCCEAAEEEALVFEAIWLRDGLQGTLSHVVNELSATVYNQFRSQVLLLDQLEDLSLIADLLRSLFTTELAHRPGSVEYLSPLVERMMQDTQERIVFRTSVFLRDNIQRATLDSQQVMLCVYTGGSVAEESSLAPLPMIDVMNNCVTLLTTLYSAVERNVFAVFAEECVYLTTLAVLRAEEIVLKSAIAHSKLHSKLMVIRHLLFLREQISRFDVQLQSVEKHLDLAKLTHRKIEIVQSSREAKKDVEAELKMACEAAVSLMSHLLIALFESTYSKSGYTEAVQTVDKLLQHFQTVLTAYVEAAPTRSVLLRPVRTQLFEAHNKVIERQKAQDSEAIFEIDERAVAWS